MSSTSKAQSKVAVSNLDLSKLRYSKVTIPKSGLGKYLTVQYDYGKDVGIKPLLLDFPLMFSWGANKDDREYDGQVKKDKYNLTVQFPRDSDEAQQTEEIRATFQKLCDLEDQLMQDAADNAAQWGLTDKRSGKALPLSLGHSEAPGAILRWPQDKKTKMIIKDDPDKKPSIQFKFQIVDDHIQCSVFNEKKQMVYCPQNKSGTISPEICDISKDEFLDLIPKFSNVKCIAGMTIWFQGGSVMPSLTVQQILCYKPQNTRVELSECLFDNGLSEEEQQRANVAAAAATMVDDDNGFRASASTSAPMQIIDESDDEAEVVMPAVAAKKPAGVVVPAKAPPAPAADTDDDVSDEEAALITAKPAAAVVAKPAAGKKVVVKKAAAK